jgi:hypothetical protein
MRFKAFLLFVLMILLIFGCSKKSTEPDDNTTVKKPVFLLPSGTYEDGQYIAIRCDTEDAVIRYTLDNSEPLISSPAYTEELRIPDFFINGSSSCIVKARAFKTGFLPSLIASATYTINFSSTVATPVISPTGGTQISNVNAAITCATAGAVIRYTTDGTEPDYYSPLYVSPLPVMQPKTIKAKAFKSGMNSSAIATTTYNLLLYEIGYYDTPGDAWDVAVRDNYAYVADREGGFRIIDITNPEEPFQVGYNQTNNYAKKVALYGTWAFIAAGNGFYVFNVSDPTNPENILYYPIIDTVNDFVIDGNYLYLACYLAGIRIFNISNPESPVQVGAYHSSGLAFDIAYSNNHIFLADGFVGLRIINVSNPASPFPVGLFMANVVAVAVSESKAYICDLSYELKVLDVTSPSSPHQIGAMNVFGGGNEIALDNGFAYIGCGDAGVIAVDIAVPASPVLHARYDTPGLVYSVKVSGSYVYVGDYSEGLRILYFNPSAD